MADLLLFRWKTTQNVLKSEAEIWPFCACAVLNTLYYPYLWRKFQNCRAMQEIWVEEHGGDVRFQTGSRNMAVFAHAQWKIRYKTRIYGGIAEIPPSYRKSGRGTRWWRQILNRKWKYGRFAHVQYKIRYISLIYGEMFEILASYRKSGWRNMLVSSDFEPEVEIWPFRSCGMKNTL